MSSQPQRTNQQRIDKLLSLLENGRSMLIVMQNCPDPDALGAAAGLRAVANARAGTQCTLAYGGTIGRAENRALAAYLGLNLRPFAALGVERYDLTALVDTQPSTGNNPFPDMHSPDIVIDHHPIKRATRGVPYTDVRSRYGATSTILFEYLQTLDITPEPPLATGLLYGIRSDTQDLGREATKADVRAFLALYPLANQRMLARIQNAAVPRAYFQILNEALHRARSAGTGISSFLGDIDNPDMIGEIADLLLRYEGSSAVLCYGIHDGSLLLSLRLTNDDQADAGKLMRQIVGRYGTGGGHNAMAGGQIPLDNRSAAQQARIMETIERRFFRNTSRGDEVPQPFLEMPQ
jgi:nanoRNase/pAp phosphatase (c-di-AMP/oligoRNAs hydrolase)